MVAANTSRFTWKIATTALLLGLGVASAIFIFSSKRTSKDETEGKEDDTGEEKVNELVQQRFLSCSQHMTTKIMKLPQSTQLELYAFYKQATAGNCQGKPPPSYDLVSKAKYEAWKKLDGMSKTSAMQLYIDKAILLEFTTSLQENGDDDDVDDEEEFEDAVMDLGGLGNRPSTLIADDDMEDGDFPLHKAASEGNVDQLSILLKQSELSPNAMDSAGQTALHLCADQGHLDCTNLLINAGASINAEDHDGITPLQAAVISGHLEVCKTLLEKGADPDQPDRDGDTPRMCAQDDQPIQLLFQKYPLNMTKLDYLKKADEIVISIEEGDVDI